MLKISLITITYNSEKTLERTIQSIINQNYKNIEYIIIDGGSIDNTLEIIKKYKDYVYYWISEPDNGISDAFNKGIKMATGEIIGIINSDDFLCEKALIRLASSYEKGVDVYRGNIILWDLKSNCKCIERPSMEFSRIPLNINVSHPGTFVRKDIYMKYGIYDLKCRYAMDLDLLLRLYYAKVTFKYVDATIACFTLGGITVSSYDKKRYDELVYILKKNGANKIQLVLFIFFKKIRVIITKLISKKILLIIRHGKKPPRP